MSQSDFSWWTGPFRGFPDGPKRFMREGVDGLLRHKIRKPGKAPLPSESVARAVDQTYHFTPLSFAENMAAIHN